MSKKSSALTYLFRFLKDFTFEYWPQGLGIFLITSIGTLMTMVSPYLIEEIIDGPIKDKNYALLFKLILVMVVSIVLARFCILIRTFISTHVAKSLFTKIRMRMFTAIQNQSVDFYDKTKTGGLLTKFTSDIDNLHTLFTTSFVDIFSRLLTVVVVVVLMFRASFHLTLSSMIFLPLFFVVYGVIVKRIHILSKEIQEKRDVVMDFLKEVIEGVSVIQMFNAQEHFKNKVGGNVIKVEEYRKRLSIRGAFASLSTSTIEISTSVVLWGYGSYLIMSGHMTLGALVAFSTLMRMVSSPLSGLFQVNVVIQRALASAERVYSVLDQEPSIQDKENAQNMETCTGNIEVKDLHFSYHNCDTPILRGTNALFNPQTLNALVGPNGSGKSTLIKLLARLYDASSGMVLIDGVNITDIRLNDVRNSIGLVPQEVYFFNDTIRNNLTLGYNYSDEEIREACKASLADSFIDELQSGYDHHIGENGCRLSGGQRQRLAIARALLKKPSILLLDEPNANIDEESENKIMSILKAESKKRTVIIVTHNKENLHHFDHVIDFEKCGA